MPSADILNGWAVLIVDDDLDNLTIVKALLSHHGAETHTAINGQQGLEMAQSLQPTFIITDLSMPVMNGWEMVKTLKQDSDTADIPVIALTAHAMVGDRERALAAGCHNYLSKPIIPDVFLDDLLALLADIPQLAEKITWTPEDES